MSLTCETTSDLYIGLDLQESLYKLKNVILIFEINVDMKICYDFCSVQYIYELPLINKCPNFLTLTMLVYTQYSIKY